MSEQTPDDTPPADLGEQASAPAAATTGATDIDAAHLDLDSDADTPATSDRDEYVEDADLGGTHGPSAGGAG